MHAKDEFDRTERMIFSGFSANKTVFCEWAIFDRYHSENPLNGEDSVLDSPNSDSNDFPKVAKNHSGSAGFD
jgi:hypothetical protein